MLRNKRFILECRWGLKHFLENETLTNVGGDFPFQLQICLICCFTGENKYFKRRVRAINEGSDLP